MRRELCHAGADMRSGPSRRSFAARLAAAALALASALALALGLALLPRGYASALAPAAGRDPDASPPAPARRPTVLPIAWHVVHDEHGPVVSDAFLTERLARANVIFAQYGVAFAAIGRDALPARHAALETRADRDALAPAALEGVINAFAVRSLRDVDDPTQMRRGVHWHAPAAHFVIVSSIAGPNVLAHELGHFLGNRAHSDAPGNLMSYRPGPGLPVLDTAQQRKLRRAVKSYLARRELRVVDHRVP